MRVDLRSPVGRFLLRWRDPEPFSGSYLAPLLHCPIAGLTTTPPGYNLSRQARAYLNISLTALRILDYYAGHLWNMLRT